MISISCSVHCHVNIDVVSGLNLQARQRGCKAMHIQSKISIARALPSHCRVIVGDQYTQAGRRLDTGFAIVVVVLLVLQVLMIQGIYRAGMQPVLSC